MPAGPWTKTQPAYDYVSSYSYLDRYKIYPYVDWNTQKGTVSTTYTEGATSRTGFSLGSALTTLKKTGAIVPTTSSSLSKTRSLSLAPFGFYGSHKNGMGIEDIQLRLSNCYPSPLDLTTSFNLPTFNDEWQRAYSDLVSDYRNARAQLAAVVAEAKETCEGMKDLTAAMARSWGGHAQKVARRLRSFRGSPKMLDALLRDIGDSWLTWSFGISPLIEDVKSAAEALAEIHETRVKIKCSGKGWSTSESTSVVTRTYFGYWRSVVISFAIRDTATARIKLGGLVSSNQSQYDPLSIAGLTPSDVLPAFWEIFPYSWLVDYVTNVGDLISLFTYPNMEFADSWSILIQEAKREITPYIDLSTGGNGTNWNSSCYLTAGGKSTVTTLAYSRGPGLGAPIDYAKFQWKNPFSSLAHDVNLTAIGLNKLGERLSRETPVPRRR